MTGLLDERVGFGQGTIGDGCRSIAYAALPDAFDGLRAKLVEAGVDEQAPIALACSNDVSTAIAILFVVHERRACALVPPGGGDDPLPFCRTRVAFDEAGAVRITHEGGGDASKMPRGICLATSGSAGRRKVVHWTHHALVANARAVAERLCLSPDDRAALPVPVFHMYGFGAGLLPCVLAGASVDLQERSNVVRYVARERIVSPTVAFSTPSFCQSLLLARHGSRPYRLTVAAGDRFPAEPFRAYEERYGTVVPLYGSTELGAVAAGDPNDPFDLRSTTCGLPLAGVELRLDESNALSVRHPAAFEGYLDDTGATVPREAGDGWHRTNDLAHIAASGHLTLLGRSDDATKRDGLLVFPADVEAALSGLPGVARLVVIAAGTTPRGTGLVAVVCASAGSLDATELRRAARERLPGHAVPDRFVTVEELPLLPSGKPDRGALRARFGGA